MHDTRPLATLIKCRGAFQTHFPHDGPVRAVVYRQRSARRHATRCINARLAPITKGQGRHVYLTNRFNAERITVTRHRKADRMAISGCGTARVPARELGAQAVEIPDLWRRNVDALLVALLRARARLQLSGVRGRAICTLAPSATSTGEQRMT